MSEVNPDWGKMLEGMRQEDATIEDAKLQQIIDMFTRNMAKMAEVERLAAKQKFAKYQSLVDAGFSEAQAFLMVNK